MRCGRKIEVDEVEELFVVPFRGSKCAMAIVINKMLCVSKSVRELLLSVPAGSKMLHTTVGVLCSELGISLSWMDSCKFGVDDFFKRSDIRLRFEEPPIKSKRVSTAADAIKTKVNKELADLLEKLGVKDALTKLPEHERKMLIAPLLQKAAAAADLLCVPLTSLLYPFIGIHLYALLRGGRRLLSERVACALG